MPDFLDISGASGARYRFRSAAPAELPVMAGNVLVASGPSARLKVLFCGAAHSLVRAAPIVTETLKANRNARLFVRLNVARAVREAEHADIVAAVEPDAEAADLD
ncbi:MAG: hypothetical protein EPO51_24585 [Phenylobacterium sp.]|uniref:hypothetical protein n=1 Tax=Phenylobacterium sp. TaxID=1871053 RepID=UPI00120D1B62|nr:hypothetical protein [Phenylobacterium sp.]TAJ68721.1 MAG: hypothetical protein EPO51_24585 [Phenylobacterium sp.]